MEITFHNELDIPGGTDAFVLLCSQAEGLPEEGAIAKLDESFDGRLSALVQRKGFKGKKGQESVLCTLGRLDCTELCLVGTGKELASAADWLLLGRSIGSKAARATWSSVALQAVRESLDPRFLEPLLRGLLEARYRFRKHASADEEDPPDSGFEAIRLLGVPETARSDSESSLSLVREMYEAVSWCRDLVNEPPSRCTPTYLAAESDKMARERGLESKVLGREACEALGMGLFLAVARGSAEPPAFIHLSSLPTYSRGPKVVLVGKGITFDSGGLSLKTAEGMKEMKSDMAGGATVLAVMSLLPSLGLSLEVHGLVPACENMPSDRSYKLGDVLRGLDGPSVEVVNTDAEGRLVLADGLAYARRLGGTVLIDVATLTGACVVALGEHTAGLFGNDDILARTMLESATKTGESLFRLPLSSELDEQLKSPVADCKNSGGRWGGAITAALFLKRFVKDTPWLHLDIAGPAYRDKGGGGLGQGATGFGVATLTRFLLDLDRSSQTVESGASTQGETRDPRGGGAR